MSVFATESVTEIKTPTTTTVTNKCVEERDGTYYVHFKSGEQRK